MGFLNQFFGKNKTQDHSEFWKKIESDQDIDALKILSDKEDVVIFKHSTRCFISSSVLRKFEHDFKESNPSKSFYLLDLLQYRDLSNRIAEDFQVPHQSPQILVIRSGKAIFNASHNNIEFNTLAQI